MMTGVSVLVIATLAWMLTMGSASAQEATPGPAAGAATVSVTGHGAVQVKPDMATVTLGVDVVRPTLPDALTESNRLMESVLSAIKAAGVAEEDVQTTSFYVNIFRNYDPSGQPGEITGFQVSNQVLVIVRDLDKLNTILGDAVAAGANSIYGIGFAVADPTAAASQARKRAVEDARARAEELAAANGMTLGRVVTVTEVTAPYGPPVTMEGAAGKGAGYAPPIQTGMVEVTVDVQVTYELVS
jgi:hypothetical protein